MIMEGQLAYAILDHKQQYTTVGLVTVNNVISVSTYMEANIQTHTYGESRVNNSHVSDVFALWG